MTATLRKIFMDTFPEFMTSQDLEVLTFSDEFRDFLKANENSDASTPIKTAYENLNNYFVNAGKKDKDARPAYFKNTRTELQELSDEFNDAAYFVFMDFAFYCQTSNKIATHLRNVTFKVDWSIDALANTSIDSASAAFNPKPKKCYQDLTLKQNIAILQKATKNNPNEHAQHDDFYDVIFPEPKKADNKAVSTSGPITPAPKPKPRAYKRTSNSSPSKLLNASPNKMEIIAEVQKEMPTEQPVNADQSDSNSTAPDKPARKKPSKPADKINDDSQQSHNQPQPLTGQKVSGIKRFFQIIGTILVGILTLGLYPAWKLIKAHKKINALKAAEAEEQVVDQYFNVLKTVESIKGNSEQYVVEPNNSYTPSVTSMFRYGYEKGLYRSLPISLVENATHSAQAALACSLKLKQ